MAITFTTEQTAIFSLGRDTNASFIVDAKAGSGKTSSLIELIRYLRGSTCVLAFNKAIATEISAKAASSLPLDKQLDTDISTAHAAGLRALKRAGWRLDRNSTNGGKVAYIVKDLLKMEGLDANDPEHRGSSKISKLVSLAKNAGFGLTSPYETFPAIECLEDWEVLAAHYGVDLEIEADGGSVRSFISLAQQALRLSNARINMIDFDDMIYLPLLTNVAVPQYANVLLDEAQDINVTRRELAFRSVKPGGRLIAVGDPNQAIYGFTGADAASLTNIAARIGPDCQTLPLSICWRCDGEIITLAQSIVPAIMPRPNAPLGKVKHVQFLAPFRPQAIDNEGGAPGFVPDQTKDFLDLPQPGDAILCRLNKPNVAVALGLLRRGQRARIEGRDLGSRLLYHVQRAEPLYAHQPLDLTRLALETYGEEEYQKLMAKKRESAAAMILDEVECVILLIDRCLDTIKTGQGGAAYAALEQLIQSLFGDNVSAKDTITLASVHKSKGREWPRVFVLGWSDYMPFHLAEKAGGWQLEQEHNLRYVAVTRAQHELILVHGVQAALDIGAHKKASQEKPRVVMARGPALPTSPSGEAATDAYERDLAARLTPPDFGENEE